MWLILTTYCYMTYVMVCPHCRRCSAIDNDTDLLFLRQINAGQYMASVQLSLLVIIIRRKIIIAASHHTREWCLGLSFIDQGVV